ncbi:MAG: nucleoside deaminase [Desulfobacteraceae bacterium]|nr:MAG: nucleoside deaminase [Desulfobacteraceae bacterium]
MQDDTYYMNLAIEQARKALAYDEVPVGAVIVSDSGRVIGTGHNRPISSNDPTSHAEIEALRDACRTMGNYRLTGVTVYATIEPCIMCMGAIIHARAGRLVYGARDLRWGAAGTLYDFSRDERLNHTLEVVSGVCEQETKDLIQGFFRHKRSK